MDSSFQQEEEKDSIEFEDKSTSDIQFEEVLNIDEIQKKLALGAEEFSLEEKRLQEIEEMNAQKAAKALAKVDKNIKKYVIYIDPENIDYMEHLSVEERKNLINKIIRDDNEAGLAKKHLAQRKRFISHVIVSCLTFVICFPILFVWVNKATEITINNYNKSKQNFSKLYKERGKVKIRTVE